jgi:phosphoribosyl 1,2-cyclic phosphate phosphodiesterase
MKCTILGCGGSLGVPQLLCECYVCTSTNPKNKRTRSSIYLEYGNTKILVDTSPDFKQQVLTYGIKQIDAILYTHAHSDHISGIDDIRPIVAHYSNKIDAYLNAQTYDGIKGTFEYIFKTKGPVYKPVLVPTIIENYSKFTVGDIDIITFEQDHGAMDSLGFRFGDLAYSTDFKELPKKSLKALEGIDTWIIDCLRYAWAPTHLFYERTLDYIEQIKPKRAILTHMAHDIDYEELKKILPTYVEPAYDGMVITML